MSKRFHLIRWHDIQGKFVCDISSWIEIADGGIPCIATWAEGAANLFGVLPDDLGEVANLLVACVGPHVDVCPTIQAKSCVIIALIQVHLVVNQIGNSVGTTAPLPVLAVAIII